MEAVAIQLAGVRVHAGENAVTEEEKEKGMRAPYSRMAIEYITIALYAGLVLAILLCAAALVALAWGLI